MQPFDTLAPQWVRKLMAEFNLTAPQAAGIVGNLGFESGGFQTLQEISPKSGRGGLGVAQWTGPRRRAFESWCANSNLAPASEEANYGYLVVELHGAYRHTIDALKKTRTSVSDAVFSVGQTYERPGGTTSTHLPGFDERLRYAHRALAGLSAVAARQPDALDLQMSVQRALTASGDYHGAIDGDPGAETRQAMRDHRARLGI